MLAFDRPTGAHGHPTCSFSAGVFASLAHQLVDGAMLDAPITLLVEREDHAETMSALQGALAHAETNSHPAIAALGQCWIAEEASAMSVFFAL